MRCAGEEALYEEDLGEDEVAAELAPVTAQLAYVNEAMGRDDEAVAAYGRVLSLAADDATTASGKAARLAACPLLLQLRSRRAAACRAALCCVLSPDRVLGLVWSGQAFQTSVLLA